MCIALWDRLVGGTTFVRIVWLAVASRWVIFYGTDCLNLEKHVFAYYSFVYNLHLMGRKNQKKKRRFSLYFFHT